MIKDHRRSSSSIDDDHRAAAVSFSALKFLALRDQRMEALLVKAKKALYALNKKHAKNIDLLSPGENFPISDHFTNFS